jgi:hypothetical protein
MVDCSLPPSWLTAQVNRATAQTAQETALEEGQAPLLFIASDQRRRLGAQRLKAAKDPAFADDAPRRVAVDPDASFFTLSKRKGPRIFQAQDRAIDDFKKIDAREGLASNILAIDKFEFIC